MRKVCTAIQYAIDNHADIINMSFGGTTEEMKGMKPYDTLIDTAYEKGILCVCAAGNWNDDVADMYPANNEKRLLFQDMTVTLNWLTSQIMEA